jgi:hypothetical protein
VREQIPFANRFGFQEKSQRNDIILFESISGRMNLKTERGEK